MSVHVIETVHRNRTEWGISFGCHNPDKEDYFEVENKEIAFGIRDKILAKFTPISLDNPSR